MLSNATGRNIKASHFQFKTVIMSLRTSTKLKSFSEYKVEEVVPDVFNIPAMSAADFHDDFYELSDDGSISSFRRDELYFDAKEKKTEKKKEKLRDSEGALEQLFFPSAAVVSKSAKEKVRSNTKSSKASKDLPLTEHGTRRQASKKSKGFSKQSRSSPSLAAMGLSSSNENKKRTKSPKSSRDSPTNINAAWNLPDMNSSKTDKDLPNNTWNLIVASLSSSIEHGRRRESSKTNIDMPDLCLSSSSEHGGRRKATKGSKDLIKKLGSANLGQFSSLEQETRRKSSISNRDSVKKSYSAPRLADGSLSSSSEHGKGRKSSKSNKGLADNSWSLADMSLSSSSEHRRKPSKGLDKLDRRSKGIIKKPGSANLGQFSFLEQETRRKSSTGNRDSVKKSISAPRLADMSLSSSSEHGKGRKSSKSNKGLADDTWSLADMSLSSSSEHRRRPSKGLGKLDRRSNDLIKIIGLVDLGPSSSSEQETRRKSSTANRDTVKNVPSSPRIADINLSSSSEHGNGRKPSKSNIGLANHTWSLADMSLSSSKGLDKLDRRSSSGLSSSSENRRKLSSKGLDKLDRSSLFYLSKKSNSSPSLARMSLLSPLEDRKRRTRKSPTEVIDE
jgi:hypothetical protein